MKSIYKYLFALLVLSLGISSCSDKYLDKISPNSPSSEDVAKDPAAALSGLLTACYDGLQDKQLYNGNPFTLGPVNLDCVSDNGGFFNWSGWKEGHDLLMGTQTPSSGIFRGYWVASYNVILRCNTFIDAASKAKGIDEKLIKRDIAEAKTIRALMYNNLIALYQDVPLILTPQSMKEVQIAKSLKAQVLAQILKDLNESIPNLPEKADLGRISKGAALSILGRVCLYNEKWQEAIAAYRQVMTLGYALDPDYAELFTLKGQTSKEIILSVRYTGPGDGEGSSIGKHWNTPLEAVNGTIDLADAYYVQSTGRPVVDKNYGALTAAGGLDITKPNPAHYTGRDPRLYVTLFVPGMTWNGKGGYGGAAASQSTIYVKKYFNDTDTRASGDSGQDFYLVRYSEVLLSLAEALVQSGSYDYHEVVSLVDQVRSRVGMPTVEKVEGAAGPLDKEALLEVIKHERRVELAFEGLRIFDLYRWREWGQSIAHIEAERINNKLGYEPRKSLGDRDYVWPIPTHELDTNKKLVQNDLWK